MQLQKTSARLLQRLESEWKLYVSEDRYGPMRLGSAVLGDRTVKMFWRHDVMRECAQMFQLSK